jgi:hypothetical protein
VDQLGSGFARSEVPVAFTVNINLFWDMTLCGLVDVSYVLVLCSEDGGETFLRNLDKDLSDYTASYDCITDTFLKLCSNILKSLIQSDC